MPRTLGGLPDVNALRRRQSPVLGVVAFIATLINEDETLWGKLSAMGLIASLPVLLAVGLVRRGLTREVSVDQQ